MESEKKLRIFVCGSDLGNVNIVHRVLAAVRERNQLSMIVETGDRVGSIARDWANSRSVTVLSICGAEEDWLTYSLKSERILGEGRPNLVISFDSSQRSSFFVEHMSKAGVTTYVVPGHLSRKPYAGNSGEIHVTDPAWAAG